MRILGAIVEPAAGFLFVHIADDLHGSAVRPQLIGHDDIAPTKAMQQQTAIVCADGWLGSGEAITSAT